MTRIDLELTPESTLPGTPQTGPQMPSDDPQMPHIQTLPENKALFDVLLTVAELKWLPSKDWIRPPTQCQE